jgi:hypothetical protein
MNNCTYKQVVCLVDYFPEIIGNFFDDLLDNIIEFTEWIFDKRQNFPQVKTAIASRSRKLKM